MTTWIVPPECQGQMIEVAYRSDGECVYRRTRDRSAGTIMVERMTWDVVNDAAPDVLFEPWNGEPKLPDLWQLDSMEYEVTR